MVPLEIDIFYAKAQKSKYLKKLKLEMSEILTQATRDIGAYFDTIKNMGSFAQFFSIEKKHQK